MIILFGKGNINFLLVISTLIILMLPYDNNSLMISRESPFLTILDFIISSHLQLLLFFLLFQQGVIQVGGVTQALFFGEGSVFIQRSYDLASLRCLELQINYLYRLHFRDL